MKVHITRIYGLFGTAARIQEEIASIAKRELHFDELGIYCYPVESDSSEMLETRLDGILASVSHGDIVILQSPTWNDFRFDESFMRKLYPYKGLGRIIFVRDILPLMYEAGRPLLQRYIDFYNQADVVILASQIMADFLRSHGLTVEKIVVQKMLDHVVSVDHMVKPTFKKVVNVVGNSNTDPQLEFYKKWNYDTVRLAIAMNNNKCVFGENIDFLGCFHNDNFLIDGLRRSGGFGLLWSEIPGWKEYMKMNTSYILSTYLAAGLPVIVPSGIGEQDTIIHKNLGFVVNSLDEAVERIEHMEEAEYLKMQESVEQFSYLLREGYFTKKALTDAVFRLLND